MLTNTPNVTEDGIVIDKEARTKFSFKTYNPQTVDFGKKQYPLNFYEEKQ